MPQPLRRWSLPAALVLMVLAGCGSGGGTTSPQPSESSMPPGFLFAESFDGGSVGEDITPADTIFNVVENEPATFEETPDAVDGPMVGRYESAGDNIRTKVEFAGTGGSSAMYERVYIWVDQYPSAVMRFLTFETSPDVTPPGEDVLALRMDPSGSLQLYDGTSFEPTNSTSDPLPLGEWVRLEVGYDATQGTHGTSTLQVFYGPNLNGTEPDEALSVDHIASPSHPVTTAAFGVLNLVDVDFSLDAIEASSDGWVGAVGDG